MVIAPYGSRMGAQAGGVEPGECAAHVGKRLSHSWQWIIGVDLVLQVDVAPIPDGLELPKDRSDRDDALAHDALTRRGLRIAQVLGVHVEDARTRVGDYPRSEERRVGKECRSRWSPYH